MTTIHPKLVKQASFKTCSLDELAALGPYIPQKTIGKGSFGKVKKALDSRTGGHVAIKVIPKKSVDSKQIKRVLREVEILKMLDHPFVVKVKAVILSEKNIYIVMEYVDGQELFSYIVSNGKLRESEARNYFRQMITAIQYCHSNFVIHRDIKPENILLDRNRNIKIVDFGLAGIMHPKSEFLQTRCGSPHYAAPELVAGRLYGPSVDIYSLGVVLYALLSGGLPFGGDVPQAELFQMMRSEKYNIPSHFSFSAAQLVVKMLKANPKERINMKGLLEDKWVDMASFKVPDSVPRTSLFQEFIKRKSVPGQLEKAPDGTLAKSLEEMDLNGAPRDSITKDLEMLGQIQRKNVSFAVQSSTPSSPRKSISTSNLHRVHVDISEIFSETVPMARTKSAQISKPASKKQRRNTFAATFNDFPQFASNEIEFMEPEVLLDPKPEINPIRRASSLDGIKEIEYMHVGSSSYSSSMYEIPIPMPDRRVTHAVHLTDQTSHVFSAPVSRHTSYVPDPPYNVLEELSKIAPMESRGSVPWGEVDNTSKGPETGKKRRRSSIQTTEWKRGEKYTDGLTDLRQNRVRPPPSRRMTYHSEDQNNIENGCVSPIMSEINPSLYKPGESPFCTDTTFEGPPDEMMELLTQTLEKMGVRYVYKEPWRIKGHYPPHNLSFEIELIQLPRIELYSFRYLRLFGPCMAHRDFCVFLQSHFLELRT